MHGCRKSCSKIYQATKHVLGKRGSDFVPRESSALIGSESLAKMDLDEDGGCCKTNEPGTWSINSRGRPRSVTGIYMTNCPICTLRIPSPSSQMELLKKLVWPWTHCILNRLESGLRLVSPFMPFVAEERWQRLPRSPGSNTCSIMIQHLKWPMSLCWAARYHPPALGGLRRSASRQS